MTPAAPGLIMLGAVIAEEGGNSSARGGAGGGGGGGGEGGIGSVGEPEARFNWKI